MKILILTLIALVSMSTIAAAKTPESLRIKVGEQKKADRGRFTVSFIEVVEDSRCPIGVNCVWAGNAKIKLTVSKGKSPVKTVELNSTINPKSVVVYGYELKFGELNPYPGENIKMVAMPRTAVITIEKVSKIS